MFAKLLKHEWRANSKLLGILSIAAAGLGVLAVVTMCIALPMLFEATNEYEGVNVLAGVGLMFLWMFIMLSIAVYSAAVSFILAYRFYKSKYTDEGYLTFTLPVSSKQIFLSSCVNMTFWSAIAAVITFVAAFGSLFAGFLCIGDMGKYFIEVLKEIPQLMTVSDGIMATIQMALTLVTYLLAFLTSIVTIHASITIGAVIVKKFKILAAIGIYYAINFGMSILVSFAQNVPSLLIVFSPTDFTIGMVQIIIQLLQIIIYTTLIIVGYKYSIKLMDEKLNLP